MFTLPKNVLDSCSRYKSLGCRFGICSKGYEKPRFDTVVVKEDDLFPSYFYVYPVFTGTCATCHKVTKFDAESPATEVREMKDGGETSALPGFVCEECMSSDVSVNLLRPSGEPLVFGGYPGCVRYREYRMEPCAVCLEHWKGVERRNEEIRYAKLCMLSAKDIDPGVSTSVIAFMKERAGDDLM